MVLAKKCCVFIRTVELITENMISLKKEKRFIAFCDAVIESVPITAESVLEQIILGGHKCNSGGCKHTYTHLLSLSLLHTQTVVCASLEQHSEINIWLSFLRVAGRTS